jgi:hypothetical protein
MLGGCINDESPTATETDALLRANVSDPTITVTNTDDSGPGSLRQAILNATDGTTIAFDPALAGSTIHLAGELDVLLPSLTIEGPAAGGITLDAQRNGRVMAVGQNTTLTLRTLASFPPHWATETRRVYRTMR